MRFVLLVWRRWDVHWDSGEVASYRVGATAVQAPGSSSDLHTFELLFAKPSIPAPSDKPAPGSLVTFLNVHHAIGPEGLPVWPGWDIADYRGALAGSRGKRIVALAAALGGGEGKKEGAEEERGGDGKEEGRGGTEERHAGAFDPVPETNVRGVQGTEDVVRPGGATSGHTGEEVAAVDHTSAGEATRGEGVTKAAGPVAEGREGEEAPGKEAHERASQVRGPEEDKERAKEVRRVAWGAEDRGEGRERSARASLTSGAERDEGQKAVHVLRLLGAGGIGGGDK